LPRSGRRRARPPGSGARCDVAQADHQPPAQFLNQPGPLDGRSGKFDALDELLDAILAEGESVLVFTQYVQMGRLIERHLHDRAIANLFLHGRVPAARREAMVDEFQAGDVPVLLLSLKAGGTGLNLTRATHVVHFDRWWNPAVEDQATDRAYRIGQDRPVQVHRLITEGTVEDRIAQLLEAKRDLAEAVVGTGEGWIGELSDEDLADLVSLQSVVAGTPAAPVREVLDLFPGCRSESFGGGPATKEGCPMSAATSARLVGKAWVRFRGPGPTGPTGAPGPHLRAAEPGQAMDIEVGEVSAAVQGRRRAVPGAPAGADLHRRRVGLGHRGDRQPGGPRRRVRRRLLPAILDDAAAASSCCRAGRLVPSCSCPDWADPCTRARLLPGRRRSTTTRSSCSTCAAARATSCSPRCGRAARSTSPGRRAIRRRRFRRPRRRDRAPGCDWAPATRASWPARCSPGRQ
jgi:hypothetical protein